MGVPKFFRYMSERYPCLSELVKEYQIPEFDNLYLDMNGIIHMCSHPDDGNPHFRITEEQIFEDIFHYIEVLFRMIKPQKLFFMAVDGVAPRAKMNQQRGRRFRSAKDAVKQETDAKKKGETLPEEARFDSNCITPGTVFMARLHEQLKYFVVDKISIDSMWQKCKVILSGQETPGEGEHKIMDYIRYMRAQPGYDPNTRHCLYGLDADLIMLGLCTHEPHFSLLREEVKFGKKSTKRMSVPEDITFYLLHLSLMREYLELEFASLKDKLVGFEYDLEKIIDDWVLMGFLVGNDFIPNLPNLHIANGALPILYKTYMHILPTLDGYINEAGSLNLKRFEKFMRELGQLDVDNFEEIKDDLLYMESKTGKKRGAHTSASSKETYISDHKKPRDSGLAALMRATELMCIESDNEDISELFETDEDFGNYKMEYYRNKLEYKKVTGDVLRDQAEGYVRAIQWNLNYYYNGCCSWSWYYPHHYAPYTSDIRGFSDLEIEFDLGTPFLPYEQLLAVLPADSKDLLPTCYHDLMTNKNSPIKKYYPEDFQTDMNGKRQEWEAVVLVPFIDENLLLKAMSYCNDKLTPEERARNFHGPMLIYTFTSENKGPYIAPSYFPDVPANHTEIETMLYSDIMIPKHKLVKGAYPGVKMDVYYPGFPTMKHHKYKATLKKAQIKVFETPSRNENMIITIISEKKFDGEVPLYLLGATVFVGWPHLVEAKVQAISVAKRKYVIGNVPEIYTIEEQTGSVETKFRQEMQGIVEHYHRRLGIEFGETKYLVHVQEMIGRKYVFTSDGFLTLEKQFSSNTSIYPFQTIVENISTCDPSQPLCKDVGSIFYEGCTCFILANPYYGSRGVIQESNETLKQGRLVVNISVTQEPDFSSAEELFLNSKRKYSTLYTSALQAGLPPIIFSRITGSVYVLVPCSDGGTKTTNIGLELKLNKKNKETPGYTKKALNEWFYTEEVVKLVIMYHDKFPEVPAYLNQYKPEDMSAGYIFGDDYEERLTELQCWLKSLPSNSVEKQSCGQMFLDQDIIEDLEKTVDCFSNKVKNIILRMKPCFLYTPELQNGTVVPDSTMEVYTMDRIINVREGFTVPFGLKGTVLSIKESSTGSGRDTMYHIMFDKVFRGGMKMKTSKNREYQLPATAFINISHGIRLEKNFCKPIATAITTSHLRESIFGPGRSELSKPLSHQQLNTSVQSPKPFNEGGSAFAQFPKISPRTPNLEAHQQRRHFRQTYEPKPHTRQNIVPSEKYKQRYTAPDNFQQNYSQPRLQTPKEHITNTQQEKRSIPADKSGAEAKHEPKGPPTVNKAFLKAILKLRDDSVDEAKGNTTPKQITNYGAKSSDVPFNLFPTSPDIKVLEPQYKIPPVSTGALQLIPDESLYLIPEDSLHLLPKDYVMPSLALRSCMQNKDFKTFKLKDVATGTATAVSKNPFVPLQAIQNSKTDCTKQMGENRMENTQQQENKEVNTDENLSVNNSENMPKETESKPKKGRKTRIAANFSKKF